MKTVMTVLYNKQSTVFMFHVDLYPIIEPITKEISVHGVGKKCYIPANQYHMTTVLFLLMVYMTSNIFLLFDIWKPK